MEPLRNTNYEDLIVITNRELVRGEFLKQIQRVLTLFPKALILREKDLAEPEYERLAVQVMDLCEKAQVPCFLHSRIELAKKLGCRCIHLPFALFMEAVRQSGELCPSCHRTPQRNSLPPEAEANLFDTSRSDALHVDFNRVSVSCHSLEEAKAAEEAGADQIILGTIYETACKPGRKGRGSGFVREVCESVSVPVYAIGGVTAENLPILKEAGAAGGCMMSGFMCL